jgi:AcrR family transcriptional regulator
MLTDCSINESAEPVSGRRRRADQRREQFLNAALELYAEHGCTGMTVRLLAERLGVAHGLVYHYFPSKQALLHAVVEHFSFLPELRRLLAVSGEVPAAQVLSQVVVRFDALLTRRGDLMFLLMQPASAVPEAAVARYNLATEGMGLLTAYLAARVAAGELRPHNLETTARLIMGPVVMAHVMGHSCAGWLDDLVPQILGSLWAETE